MREITNTVENVTGRPTTTLAEFAHEAGGAWIALLGRTITYQELTFEEHRDAMIRAGIPGQIAAMTA